MNKYAKEDHKREMEKLGKNSNGNPYRCSEDSRSHTTGTGYCLKLHIFVKPNKSRQ